ncbi:MAG: hypothetical protein PHS57_08330 [Alphaproteobacteria bacterium]|nr:hypothetical protein [Alphaproteobacteria bacterium]
MDRKRHSVPIKGLVTAGTFLAVFLALTSAPLSEARAADKLAIDSVQGADLPIGASGQRAMTICGGGPDCGGVTGPVIIGTSPPNAVPQATLDVNGTLHLAPAAEGHSCSSLGAQAYNGTTGAPLYCGGSNGEALTWKSSSGATRGTLCGLAFWSADPTKALNHSPYCTCLSTLPCNGQDIIPANATWWWWVGDATPSIASCPPGYSPASRPVGTGATYATIGALYYTTCLKD